MTTRFIKFLVLAWLLPVGSSASIAFAAPSVGPFANIEMKFEQREKKLLPVPKHVIGGYWGSGRGRISGRLNGTFEWDLYEDATRDDLHRGQIVGQISTDDGAKIPFETIGYYRSRDDGHWDLTASVDLNCNDHRYPWLHSLAVVWRGSVKWGEWVHRAKLYAIDQLQSAQVDLK